MPKNCKLKNSFEFFILVDCKLIFRFIESERSLRINSWSLRGLVKVRMILFLDVVVANSVPSFSERWNMFSSYKLKSIHRLHFHETELEIEDYLAFFWILRYCNIEKNILSVILLGSEEWENDFILRNILLVVELCE